MAFSKAYKFKPEEYHFSLMCKALAHPARLKLISNIAKHEIADFKQASHEIPLTIPTIFQHLKVLREMHVIICTDAPPKVLYEINFDLPNTTIGLIQLAMTHDLKYDVTFEEEIRKINRQPGLIQKEIQDA